MYSVLLKQVRELREHTLSLQFTNVCLCVCVFVCMCRFWQDLGIPGPYNKPVKEGGSRGGCGPKTEETTGTHISSF